MREEDENAALQAVAVMQKGRVVDLDSKLALEAARLGLRQALPMADAIILASARAHAATLWTQDAHFKAIESVRYVPRGNSSKREVG